MTTRVDVEDIETTKSEKLLATVLTAFLLVAALWIYFHVDVEGDYTPRESETVPAAERAAIERRDRGGVLVLSAAGALLTIAAFAVLQRYLGRRLPRRRVRRRECPFCGFPTGDGPHCAGCGREVVAECATCHAERRVGTDHCAACGSA